MQRSAEQLAHAITTLEARRALLGDDVVDMALVPLRAELAALHTAQPAQPVPPGQQSVESIRM